ncbi:fatty acid desaturase [Haliangium sp.]|uniref:fatty acid desaturase n=1 Tax=Haliangium sp. TaxID=2663208 RepID=UPI003D0EFC98
MKLVEGHNRVVFHKKNFLHVVAVHLVVLAAAPWLFTWSAFLFAFAAIMVFGYAMGIFHHMLLTHRSFKCSPWIEKLGSLMGTLTWRGPFAGPVQYVAMHRVHHAYSDTENDPHTPTKGIWYALLAWFWRMPYGFSSPELYDRHARDLLSNRWHVFLDRNVHLVQLAWAAICFAGGALAPLAVGGPIDPVNGLRYVVYGVFVKTLMGWYLINAVDVINHTIGYRNYETEEDSTNSFLMAFIHGGGAISWHNNHHAHMGYFTVKRRWWEFDVHRGILRFLGLFGLVSDIKVLDETRRAAHRPARRLESMGA